MGLSKCEYSFTSFSLTCRLMRSSVYRGRSKGNLIHLRYFELKGTLAPPTLCLIQKPVGHLHFTSFAYLNIQTQGVYSQNFMYFFLSKFELNVALLPNNLERRKVQPWSILFSHVSSICQNTWHIGSAQSIDQVNKINLSEKQCFNASPCPHSLC